MPKSKIKNPVVFTGELRWAHTLTELDTHFDPKWKVNQILDDESLERFKELDFQIALRSSEGENDGKIDPNGNMVVWTRRETRDFGDQVVKYNPPVVEMADGSEIPEDILIGNGSQGECHVFVAALKDGKSFQRLEKVVITDLVVYEPDTLEDDPGIAKIIRKDEVASSGKNLKPAF